MHPAMAETSSSYTLQCCPVCRGRGTVPIDFYTRVGSATSTASETCLTCDGAGLLNIGGRGNVEKVR